MNSWLIARLASNYMLRRVALMHEMFDVDMVDGRLIGAVYDANLGHLVRDPELSRLYGGSDVKPPPGLRHPISAYALATALDLPRETVRRKVKILVAQGVLHEDGDGLIVGQAGGTVPTFGPALERMTALTEEFCGELIEAGTVGAIALAEETDAPSQPRHRVIMVHTTAFALRFLEDFTYLPAHSNTIVTYLAIMLANTRHIDWRRDPTMFEAGMLPVSMRRPVTALAIADQLCLSRETTRRLIHKLAAQGHARISAGGVVIDPSALPDHLAEQLVARVATNTRRLLTNLRGSGLKPTFATTP